MAVLVDTCGWIEWLTDGELATRFQPYMQSPEDIVIPTAIQFELYKWIKREVSETDALDAIALAERCHVVALTTSISLLAADFALSHQLSFADAIIYATAQHEGVDLVTSDDHFMDLPDVIYFAKSSK